MRFQISDLGKDFEISVKISKDFNEISRSEQSLGICHSSVVFTTQPARDNDNAHIWTILASKTFQQPGNSHRKWTQQEGTQSTQPTTQCSTVETWEPCLITERPRVGTEMSLEAVSCCDLVQNLETVQLLISKKDLNKTFVIFDPPKGDPHACLWAESWTPKNCQK